MQIRELRYWVGSLSADDNIEVINGNTLTATRNGVIIDSLYIGGTSFADYRKQIYREYKNGARLIAEGFFKSESAL